MNPHALWKAPPEQLLLPTDEIHVWSVSLREAAAKAPSFSELLAADERLRAERLIFQKDRDRFIMARAALRIILGRYLRTGPARLSFDYNSYGKPVLKERPANGALCFNLSHSHEMALYAFTLNHQIGIDLEYVRADFPSHQLAKRFFSASESARLRSLPADQQTEAFFNCWTRKEAYIKARGKGLSLSLHGFDVSFAPGEPAALLSVREEADVEPRRWSLQALVPEPGYVAALAVDACDLQLKCWRWTD